VVELFDPSIRASSRAASRPQSRVAPARARASALAASGNSVLDTLYAVRDQVLALSPQGRYYTRLYYLNSPELVQIVLYRPDLIARGGSTLLEWQPALQSLASGQGSGRVISLQMITDLTDVLNELKALGSPRLATTIQQEQDALNLPSFVNLPMDQAWAQAQQRIVIRPLPTAYLPLVAR
jgi:hypothetical protein